MGRAAAGMRILVIDVGASHVKFTLWRNGKPRKFASGKGLTPRKMMRRIQRMTQDWKYDAVSLGIPGPVIHGRPAGEPPRLGRGWTRFDFEKHFGKPVKIINDAAMQALGSYRGGRMLFVGLGTGLGSALILDDVIVPLELGDLSYSKGRALVDVLGQAALESTNPRRWEKAVHNVVNHLAAAFRTDYLVIGGGNAKRLRRLPRGARRGSNSKAFLGGARLWRVGAVYATPKKHIWVIT